MDQASHDGRPWGGMHPGAFDARRATPAERKIIATAAGTLFPEVMPEVRRRPAPAAPQLPGQDDLFGDLA